MISTISTTAHYLTAPDAQKTEQYTYRWMVEMISNMLELDCEGNPVPVEIQTIDVLVTAPGEEPVRQLIAVTGWLNGFSIVRIWEPEDCCEAF